MIKIKHIIYSLAIVLVSCNSNTTSSEEIAKNYNVYGDTIAVNNVISSADAQLTYQKLPAGDTTNFTFKAKVVDVCHAKGCWMKLDLENGEEAMVRFKDYGFFVPKDIKGKEVVLGGKAFVDLMSVEDQKHYAMDAGKPEEEIERITTPIKTYSFEATGVLLKK
ncbi:DUF4920 domain-containing protein [Joostella sp. CR20]|uniref:DUF4920 domain-containing protein n=1 Tax=Joostella sp. CR20 TaxID=2804312 RepID=UPI00313E10CF